MSHVSYYLVTDDEERLKAVAEMASFLPLADAIVIIDEGVVSWHGDYDLAFAFTRYFLDPKYADESIHDIIEVLERKAEEKKVKVLIVDYGRDGPTIVVVVKDKPLSVPHT